MKIKKILKYSLPIVVIVLILTYYGVVGEINRNKFYDNTINEKIIDSSDYQKRVIEYILESGIRINISVLDSVDLKVGDSISKEAFSYKFDIFRKENKEYIFYRNYNIESRY